LLSNIASFLKSSNNLVYSVGEGESAQAYDISINITIKIDDNPSSGISPNDDFTSSGSERANTGKVQNPLNNIINSFNSSTNHPSFKSGKNGGVADGRNAFVKSGLTTSTKRKKGAHEVGHNFGMPHSNGMMSETAESGLRARSVGTTLARVGIGTGTTPTGAGSGDEAIGHISSATGTAPVNFNGGTVMTRKTFERRLNKAIRQRKRREKKNN
jgi:hypothetical protein